MNQNKETEVWNHYIDYLVEATHKNRDSLSETINHMKNSIAEGCTLEELRVLMLSAFEPVTIMQALEQWQNQMDLMLHTGLKKFKGVSRYEHYVGKNDKAPYDFMVDAVLDDHSPDAHIYDLSGITQTVLHIASEYSGKDAPALIIHAQKECGLEENFEIKMLLGDSYRQRGRFKEALLVYEELWDKNGHQDLSIQDAITFTKFVMKSGPDIKGKQMDEWIDDYHDFKKQETVRRTSPKISRNDPCPCGSGKKYKYCCGR